MWLDLFLIAFALVPFALLMLPAHRGNHRPLQPLPPASADDEVVLIRRIHAARTVC